MDDKTANMSNENKPASPPAGAGIRINAVMERLKKDASACIQCGTCTGSCPNAFYMEKTPRHLWRLVLMGETDEIFKSRTFALCSTCYTCTLRCPRGLPLTEMMGGLKRAAFMRRSSVYLKSRRFYESFMDSVRLHGRVNESEFMTRFFIKEMNPSLPLKYAPLGIKLMSRGKVRLSLPLKNKGTLDAIFRKAAEMEERL